MNNTLIRAISGGVYVALLLSATIYSEQSLQLLFGIFLIIAIIEFCTISQIAFYFPLLLATGIYIYFNSIQTNKTNDILLTIIAIFTSLKALLFLFDGKNSPLTKLNKYLYLLGYITVPIILITKIPVGVRGYNPKILISIFILIWVNDTFAFLVGKNFGKHKLFEQISPKKTIEGFIGGMFFAVIASIMIAVYFIQIKPKNLYIWILIAIIVSIFGTLGDLIESKFKRIAGVKDSGTIMPGHGGILDRLDSIIFVAPFVFLFYQILYYVS